MSVKVPPLILYMQTGQVPHQRDADLADKAEKRLVPDENRTPADPKPETGGQK